jgi:hypothetical protein
MPVDREALIDRLAALPGAALGEGAFSPGPAIWAGRREIAHFDPDGALDVRLTRAVIRLRRAELESNQRVTLRASSSDWIAVGVDDDESADCATEFVASALAVNLPTTEPGPPPSGADLERRRRFH